MRKLMNYNPKILVVGDLMVDHYVWGECTRISPEAPVPVLKVISENNRLGGACNVANNLVALGSNVTLCGLLGDDDDGINLLRILKDSGIDTHFVIKDSNFKTIKKTRLLASNQQVLRVDREVVVHNALHTQNLLNAIKNEIATYDSIIISDYNKGFLTYGLTQGLIALANANNKPILCDPKGNDYSKYAHSTLITPNKKEAQSVSNITIDSAESLSKVGFELKNTLNLQYCVITLSEDGIALFDTTTRQFPTYAKEVYDVTGAGDTVISALAFGISCGLCIDECVVFANAAAAVVVSKIGSAVASMSEVFEYLDSENIDNISLISLLKKDGKKIVFTNGCFDILHIGHVSYLKEAKSFGDILVVGLNSDNSIRRLKGDKRPINPQDDRAFILRSLEFVDFVIIFDEDTPLELIKTIKPDVLVKGSDYEGKEIVGSDIVNDVRLVDFVENKSTTNILRRIIENN